MSDLPLANDRLLRALRREPVDRTPIWIMRQAGRYLPEYRATRQQAGDFLTLCKTPELACEVTLQPLQRFALDAAILFSDILTIPDAMGLGLAFAEGEGPTFANPLRDARAIEKLGVPDPETELRYVLDAARLVRAELDRQEFFAEGHVPEFLAERPEIDVILTSGDALPEALEDLLLRIGGRFLRKPFAPKSLLNMIEPAKSQGSDPIGASNFAGSEAG